MEDVNNENPKWTDSSYMYIIKTILNCATIPDWTEWMQVAIDRLM